MLLSSRISAAFDIARRAHAAQVRKGNGVPYLSHPMAVAALVMESGGSEDQICAALLHDVLEDAGPAWRDEIELTLGPHVLLLVEACTDGLPDENGHKESWRTRKNRYIEHLSHIDRVTDEALLICAADKLHNLRSLLIELQAEGPDALLHFVKEEPTLSGKTAATLWYYDSLVRLFEIRRLATAGLLRRTLENVRRLVEDIV